MFQVTKRLKPTTILLNDKKTLATIYPIESCKSQLPLDLLEFLCEEFNTEILTSSNNGDITFPFFNALTLLEFQDFWFTGFSGIMILGEDIDLFSSGNNFESRQWEREFLGTFSLNAKYPARSSQIATGNFLVNIGVRNQGIGTILMDTMLAWAKIFNYKYCMFDNVYGTNQSMIKIMNKHHFRLIGSINNAGILGPLDNYNGDILDDSNKFTPLLIYGKPIIDIIENTADKILSRNANGFQNRSSNRTQLASSNSIFESNNDVFVDIHIDPNSQPYLSEIQNIRSDIGVINSRDGKDNNNSNDSNSSNNNVYSVGNPKIKDHNNDNQADNKNSGNKNSDDIRDNIMDSSDLALDSQNNESMDNNLSKIDSKNEKYPIVVTCTLEDDRKIHINFNLMDFLRFKRIRYFLENSKYPEGCNTRMKSRLRAAATRYSLQGTKLMFKDKEVIDDPIRMVEIVRSTHIHTDHSGINKVTSLIGEHFHFIGIKNIVVQYLKNCPHCKETKLRVTSTRKSVQHVPQFYLTDQSHFKADSKNISATRVVASTNETYSINTINVNPGMQVHTTERNKKFVEMFFDSDSDDPEYHDDTSDVNSSSEVEYEYDNNVIQHLTSRNADLYRRDHAFSHLTDRASGATNSDADGDNYNNVNRGHTVDNHNNHDTSIQIMNRNRNLQHLQLDSDDEDDSDYKNESDDEDGSSDDEIDTEEEEKNGKSHDSGDEAHNGNSYNHTFGLTFKRRKHNEIQLTDLNDEENHANELIKAVYKHR